ncbi:putative oxidoreductase [Pseudolysinimonas yzui]|uniref:Putative oxidoreductase n=2 Tax=Pseudolysinimonas yzui TaxID=2708254 RepID=A0A8J3GRE2_9MICO|nr:putative oxidoreductase [Pseudolysinimonas yzui]
MSLGAGEQIGFLGLGTMGREMAGRLVAAGHDVVIWNRSPEPVAQLVAAGASAADSPADALAAPISFSMLANDAAADEVLSAAHLAGEPGRLHVAMASLSPAAAEQLAERHAEAGVAYLAAPVLGRFTVAAAGELNIIAAGAAADLERAAPFFEILGKRVWTVGTEPRIANVVKAAVNYTIIHALQAIGESVALVEANDVDAGLFTELLSSTLFPGPVYSGYGAIIAERRYRPPGFTMALGSKDLGLAEAIAAEAGLRLPTAPVLRRVFDAALASEDLGDVDWSGIAEITRQGRFPAA